MRTFEVDWLPRKHLDGIRASSRFVMRQIRAEVEGRDITQEAEAVEVVKGGERSGQGVAPREIGVFARTPELLVRARAAVQAAGGEALELSERGDDPGGRVSIGTMHLAKGLEFKAVAVIACDEDALPLRSGIDSATDEAELEDVYDTERQLLYVAATRARDRLLVTGIKPGSEFLHDLGG